MDLLSQVKSTIQKHAMISPGEVVLAGVSGGPDSLALLYLLFKLREDLQFELKACHLDHMFRGEEARADALLAQKLASQWQIPFVMERVDVPKYLKKAGFSPQQGAREVRYQYYQETAARLGANRVALGHHADDQAETVLLNLIRGTGLKGLSGMPPVREDFYIRPLLEIRKSQLEEYCRKNEIPYRVDSSNLKKVYLRNRVRLELIPLLEENYNPAIINSLNRLAEIARDEDEYLDCIARNALDLAVKSREKEKVILYTEKVNNHPVAVRRRMFMMAFRELVGFSNSPAFEHIQKVMEVASNTHFRGEIELPGKLILAKRYHVLEIILNKDVSPKTYYQYKLKVPGETHVSEINCSILAEILEVSEIGDLRQYSCNQALLDFETLKSALLVRSRREGDVFSPLGMGGRVKLKNFFIDLKVPRENRDSVPIVTCGDDIVWVAGYRPGEPWRVTDKTRVCLHLELLTEKAYNK